MLQKDNRYKILQVFFEDPLPEGIGFHLREISRKAGIAPPSVKRYLQELEKEKLVVRKRHRVHGYPVYYANRDSDYFRLLKKQDTVRSIKETGLLDFLAKSCMPDAVVLFGSASRGEDLKKSDIDLFLLCKEKRIDLAAYEMVLGRKLHVFFAERFNKLSNELKNNIINGTIIYGYLKVF